MIEEEAVICYFHSDSYPSMLYLGLTATATSLSGISFLNETYTHKTAFNVYKTAYFIHMYGIPRPLLSVLGLLIVK